MANYDVKGYIKDSNNYYFKDATARSSITTVDNKIGNLSTTQVTGNTVAAQISALNGKIPTTLASLTADSTHRLVTDTQISTWNNKADKFSNRYVYIAIYDGSPQGAIFLITSKIVSTSISTLTLDNSTTFFPITIYGSDDKPFVMHDIYNFMLNRTDLELQFPHMWEWYSNAFHSVEPDSIAISDSNFDLIRLV